MMDPATEVAKISSKLVSAGSGKRKKLLAQLDELVKHNPRLLGQSLKGLLAAAGDKDPGVVGPAFRELDKIGRSAPGSLIPVKAKALKWALSPSSKPETMVARGNAAKVLGHIVSSDLQSRDLMQLTTPLLTCLKPPVYVHDTPSGEQVVLYSGAAFFLGNMLAVAPSYIRGPVPALGVAVRNSSAEVRFNTLLGMEAISKKHPEYLVGQIPSITRNITYPLYRADNSTPMQDRMYISAMYIIGRVVQVKPGEVTEAIPSVVSCLRDTYTFAQWCSPGAVKNPGGMRAIASNTLALIQQFNPAALLPAIIERLGEEREVGEHMERVFYELAEKQPQLVAPYILPGLNKPSPLVRRRMITAIGYIGPTQPILVKDTVSSVLGYISDRDRFLRRAAVFALGGLAKGSPESASELIPKILTAFDDTYENVQIAAVEALEGIWLSNPKSMGGTIHTLNRSLASNRQSIRARAALTLKRLQIDESHFRAFVSEMENTKKVLDEAVRAGTSVVPAEDQLQMAYREIEMRNWPGAIAHVREAGEVMKRLQSTSRPNLSILATTPSPFVEGELVEIRLEVTNTGTSTAKQIKLDLPKEVEVSGMGLVPPLDPGRSRVEHISVRPLENLQRLFFKIFYVDNDGLRYRSEIEVMFVAPGMKPPSLEEARLAQRNPNRPEVQVSPSSGTSSQFLVSGSVDFSDPRLLGSRTRSMADPGDDEIPELTPLSEESEGTPPPGMKFCLYCATAIPVESVFCYKCGKKN